MAAAAQKQSRAPRATKIAASVRSATTNSPVASLPSRATTESATAGRAQGLATGHKFTGQWLYDRLIGDDQKAELSKMDVVRQLLPLTVEEFRGVVADFVKVSKGYLDNAIAKAKESGKFDENNPPVEVRDAKGKLKTAQNHQNVMRVTYGALKFADKQLAELGGSDKIGYQLMRDLGTKALDMAGLNWDGTKAAPKPTPAEKQARQQQQEQAALFAEAMAEHKQKDDEDRGEYFARLDAIVTKKQKALAKERHEEAVRAKAQQVRELLGDELDEVLNLLLNPEPEQTADKNLH